MRLVGVRVLGRSAIAVGLAAGLFAAGCASQVSTEGAESSPVSSGLSSAPASTAAPPSSAAASPAGGSPSGSISSPQMSTPSVSVADTACNPDQLRAEVFGPAGTAGSSVYRIRISDVGGPCVLRGSPTFLLGVDAAGKVERLNPVPLNADDTGGMTSGEPADLTSASSADVVLLAGFACPAAAPQAPTTQTFRSLQLGVDTDTLAVPYGGGAEPLDTSIWLPCGVAMSAFYASVTGEYDTTATAPSRT